jgi:hypothetical protein
MEKDFERLTKDKANGKLRLLILDGHNSHCTYKFCEFAQKHNIVIICLPPHTTHALQPCDVGVFGPLSQHWKRTVTMSTSQHVAITRQNFLIKYSDAHQGAFTTATITAAWRKTGIYPLDRTALPDSAFAPATSTTTTSSQPIPAELSPILVPTPTTTPNITPSPSPFTTPALTPVATPVQTPTPSVASAAALTADNEPASPSPEPEVLIERYHIETPLRLTAAASRQALVAQNNELRGIIIQAGVVLEQNYAQMKLMDIENERLRVKLFNKIKKKEKSLLVTTDARHMTSEEMLHLLAREEWKRSMKEVYKKLGPVFKLQRKRVTDHMREEAKRRKAEAAENAALANPNASGGRGRGRGRGGG